MKTKKEKLLKETYNKFIQISLSDFPMRGIGEFIDQKVMGYGTTVSEKVLTIDGFRELVNRQREQGKDIKMTFETTPVILRMASDGNSALFVDEFVLSIHLENNPIELFLRLSTILEYRDKKWIVIHWHGSKPEYEEGETDTWHINEWKQKTEELERLVDEKTADLEIKNRELEIEAALERVRARTMGMQNSEELPVVANLLFLQIQSLGIPTWSAGYNNLSTDKRTAECWMSSEGAIQDPFTLVFNDEASFIEQYNFFQSDENFLVQELHGKALGKHYAYMKTIPKIGEVIIELEKSGISLPSYQINHLCKFEQGYLLFISYEPVPEAHEIFIRFTKVFEQTYTRFLDLQKAETQAREAQIEVALERVRARSMAMHKSEELADLSLELVKQVQTLGVATWFCAFNIYDDDPKGSLEWGSNGYGTFPKYRTPREGVFLRYYEAGQSGESLFINEISENECPGHYEYLCSLPGVGEQLLKMKDAGIPFPTSQIDHVAFLKYGYILFITFELALEAHDIFKRFAKVFEQSYTRFLDLQKAEAQSREGKIQLALERVRMVALSLTKSEEMLNVAQALYEQLLTLGFPNIRNAIIDINNGDDDTFTDYDYSHEMLGTITQMSYHDDPTLEGQFKKMATTTNDFFELVLEDKELKDLIAMRIKNGEDEDPRLLNTEILTYNLYSFGNGAIGISYFGVLSLEEKSTLNRFSNVFTFAYKRYNDLATAEARAREVQIELSLERIRVQALAMKESPDLLDIVVTMRTEFVALGHEAHYFWHMRWQPEIYEKAMTSGDGTRVGMVMDLPRGFHGNPAMIEWEKNNEPVAVFPYDADGAIDYVDKMIKTGDFHKIDHNALGPDDIRAIGGLTFIMARTTHGEIGYSLPGVVTNPPTEDLATLVRFAVAFDLAYRRFEDLKEAEAQAKEAQIEAALERVRSKAMAMHKSNDLTSAVATLFEELKRLDLKTIRLGIGIFHDFKTKKVDVWTTSSDDNNDSVHLSGDEALEGHPLLDGIYDAWQNQHDFSYVLEGKDLLDYYNVAADSNLPVQAPEVNSEIDTQYYHVVNFPAGGLFAFQESEFTTEAKQLMRRFADVFHLTFIRHLDLKSAEAQNKIIQAENERKTEELEEARELQLSMLPKELPQLPNLDIAVYMQTATEVGGDYYDFHVEDDGTLIAVIGDATGHGLKAGTIVTITKSLFHSLADGGDILSSFSEISRVIKGMNFRQLSMCLIMMEINGNQLSISSAAMPPAFIYRKKDKSVEELSFQGMPLGAMKNFPYQLIETKLQAGDTMFLFSDGLPELMNGQNEMYGYDKTKTEFQSVGEKNPEEIVNYFKNSASDWADGNAPDDDVTFVVIKMNRN
ncbi:MAG: SpoIIE family protein phosphatase [Melioribacteraceae bacterium]